MLAHSYFVTPTFESREPDYRHEPEPDDCMRRDTEFFDPPRRFSDLSRNRASTTSTNTLRSFTQIRSNHPTSTPPMRITKQKRAQDPKSRLIQNTTPYILPWLALDVQPEIQPRATSTNVKRKIGKARADSLTRECERNENDVIPFNLTNTDNARSSGALHKLFLVRDAAKNAQDDST